MNRIFSIFFMLVFICIYLQNAYAGVITSIEDIINGRKNLNDPRFSESVNFKTGIGAAVNYLLNGDETTGQSVKVEILRSALTALENLPEAGITVKDISSLKIYEALVMYDIISQQGLFTEDEKAGLRNSFKSVLSHYLNLEICEWTDDYWSLGVSPMRIVASCVLYALNFPEDQDSGLFFKHGQRYFQKNLDNSIDDYGAWVTDSPGYAGAAVEYMIVTAKALRNSGIQNHFSNPRLKNLLLYEMNLLPPQQCFLVKGAFMIAGIGQTDPGINHGGNAVISAADIYPYFPDEASNLIWYWNQCGNPLHPLGVLFIDTAIPYMMPEGKSMLAGGGTAVLRDNFATAKESTVFVSFGDAYGVYDRERHDQSDHGDYSFVWSGIPILVHDGFNNYDCSENLMNRAAWRHNLVLYEGAGDLPVIPESVYRNQPVKPDITGNRITPADFYSDGISQFISTELVDYVSGPVRLAKSDMPASSHYRHFLFLKPDAMLIWDQIESQFPIEWNLWMPVENARAEGSVLKLYSSNDVELNVLFAGDNAVDFEIEKPADEKKWDWPFIMRSKFGSGAMTLLSIDLGSHSFADSSTFALNVLQNIIFQYGEPELIGLIGGNNESKEILNHFRLNFEYLEPENLGNIDLSKYSLLFINDINSGSYKRHLNNYIWKINKYINDGGKAVWMCLSPLKHGAHNISGPGFFPVTIAPDGCSIELSDEIDSPGDIIINEDAVWLKPNPITPDSWIEWISKTSIESEGNDLERKLSVYTPAVWSDFWEVLASVRKSFPLKAYSHNFFGEPSRIRVKHPESKDFFTLLLPRKKGEPYSFDITGHGRGFVSFADPVTTWEIKAGKTSWTDANLSVRISKEDGSEILYAFDCTYITLESEKINAESPMSIYYSPRDDSGIILTGTKNIVTYSKGAMKLHAGEINFSGLKGELSLERQAFLTDLSVADHNGVPVEWATVYVDGRFIGSTNKEGKIPIRWKGYQPETAVKFRGAESLGLLVPGEMGFVIGDE